jgi:hypothetical protein
MTTGSPVAPPRSGPEVALLVTWGLLLGAVLAAPALGLSADPGDDLTRNTVRLALLFYAPALALFLLLRPEEWRAEAGRGRLARWCWTLGWASYLVHLGMAFHHYHGWSHARAVRHVEDVAGFGPGIYVSHLFTAVWTVDVAWWWARPASYAARPAWVGRALHGFLAFVTFNATVVYETGPIRWAGLALFAGLAAVLGWRWRRARPVTARVGGRGQGEGRTFSSGR